MKFLTETLFQKMNLKKIQRAFLFSIFLCIHQVVFAQSTIIPATVSVSKSSTNSGNSVTVACALSIGPAGASSSVVSIDISAAPPLKVCVKHIGQIQFLALSPNSDSKIYSSSVTIPLGFSGPYYIIFSIGNSTVSKTINVINNCNLGTPVPGFPGTTLQNNPTPVTTTTPTFTWSAVPNADNYGVFIKDNATNTLIYSDDCASSITSLTIPAGVLQAGRSYRWNMNAKTACGACGSCVGGYSTLLYFNIDACGSSSPPLSVSPASSTISAGNKQTLTLNGGSLGTGASWKWYSGSCGGTYAGTGTSIDVSPATTTKYFVRAENNCGSSTTCVSAIVTVGNGCTGPTLPSSITQTPSGSNIILSVAGGSLGSSAQWNWYQGDCSGTYYNSGSSIVVPNTTAKYSVRAVGQCGNTDCISTNISGSSCDLPQTTASLAAYVTTDSFYANWEAVQGNITGYYVDVSTTANFSAIFRTAYLQTSPAIITGLSPQTNYYYRVRATNLNTGCTANVNSNVIFVQTNSLNPTTPNVSFSISGPNLINVGSTVQFTGIADLPVTSWQWSFQGGSPSQSNSQYPSVTYTVPGTYRVSLTACNGNSCNNPAYTQVGFINVRPTNATPAKVPPQVAAKQNGNSNQYLRAEPVQVGTGSYAYKHTDLNVPVVGGSIQFTRFYNSLNAAADGPLGYGWSHTYNYRLVNQQDTLWNLQYPDGHHELFVPIFNGGGESFALYTGNFDKLHKNSGGDFTLYTKDNHRYHFTASGQLDQITDLNNNITTLTYSGNDLVTVTGPGGRTLSLTYNNGKIFTVADPLNRQVNFGYDAVGTMHYVSSANGPFTFFTYDPQYRLLTIGNPLGVLVVTNKYDAAGRVKQQIDADSKSTTFTYDSPAVGDAIITNPDNSQVFVHHDTLYRKTAIKDEMGFTQSFAYDMNSDLTQYTNQNDVTAIRTFDPTGNLLTDALPGGIINAFTYNSFNSPVQLTDPKGNNAVISYDGSDNPQSMQLPDNTFWYYTSYANGLRHTLQDGRGNITTFTYSNEGDLVASAAPNGTRNYGYDAAGRLTSVIDENGIKTKITYDNDDNLKGMENAAGRSTTFTYDVAGQLTAITDRKGNTTAFAYDRKGRLISKTNAALGITKYSYDVMDNLVSVSDPSGHIVKFGYDKLRRKISMTTALGTSQYKYDGVGNLLQLTDAANKTTTYTYSVTNKVKTAADGLANATLFDYDLNDNLQSVTDAANKATVYTYDAMNRLVSVLDAANNTTAIAYDENGNRKTVQDPNGHVQTFTWDAANRLSGLRDAAGNNYSYGYDAAGNNTRIDKPTGSIAKTYDPLNRLTAVSNSTGSNYSFSYDDNDNIISAGSNAGTSALGYNNLDQLTQYTDPYANKVMFGYDATGNKNLVTYPGDKTVSYTYNGNNQLATVKDWLGHTFTYTYDAAGRPAKLLYPNGTHCDYTFDNAARLTAKKTLTSGSSVITSSLFTLDAVGNRTAEQRSGPMLANLVPAAKVYAYSDDDAMQNDSTWTFTNDNSGNRIKETKGSITASYNFAVDNRLDSYTDTTGHIRSFSYDAWGNRLARSVDNTINRYVLDISGGLSKVLQMTDGNGNITSQYVYGAGLLERIDAGGNALYYHYDAQHNATALSDANGVIQDKYTFDPFGTLISHEGSTDQPFTFLGEYGAEQETNSLYFDRARYYDAVNGRFLSKDSYHSNLKDPQTLNRYVYGLNSPMSRYDANGLFSWQTLTAGVLQTLVAAGDVAEAGLSVIVEGDLFDAGSELNEASKSAKAAFQNFKNINTKDFQYVESTQFSGSLDAFYENKYVKYISNVKAVVDISSFFGKDIPDIAKALTGIATSNYSATEKVKFLEKYLFLSPNSPILSVKDYIDNLNGLGEYLKQFVPQFYNSLNGNGCK